MFQVVVSERDTQWLGTGTTRQKTARCIYFYAEKNEQGELFVQPLNGQDIPAGDKTLLDDADFCRRYKPEPLVFYNKVKPALDKLRDALDKGDAHRQAERFDKAQRAYAKALELDPDNLRAIFGLGIVSLALGCLEDAQESFDKLMSLEFPITGDTKHLFNEFGIRLRKNGMLPQALEWYSKALCCSRCDPHLFYNVARLHYELGEFAAAEDRLQRALELEPELQPAQAMLRAVQKAAGRPRAEQAA